jgi:hypothetical protein
MNTTLARNLLKYRKPDEERQPYGWEQPYGLNWNYQIGGLT